MPTYEYRCKSCGHQLEVQQAFTDDPLTECPECQGALRKVYGNVGISFKGSGFYRTDSRAGEKKGTDAAAPATSTSSASSTGGSSVPSTSSKSEAKSSPASSGS